MVITFLQFCLILSCFFFKTHYFFFFPHPLCIQKVVIKSVKCSKYQNWEGRGLVRRFPQSLTQVLLEMLTTSLALLGN